MQLGLLSILKVLLQSGKLDTVLGLIPSCKYLECIWRKMGIQLSWARNSEAHGLKGSYVFPD